jgi:hypothetical protein
MFILEGVVPSMCHYKKAEIPPFGGIVFASDILHGGDSNKREDDNHTFRGFCMFQGDESIFPKLDITDMLYRADSKSVSLEVS